MGVINWFKSVIDRLLHSSQRLFSLLLVVILLLVGAVLGKPGEFPATEGGGYLSPEFLLNMLAPLGLILTTVVQLFRAIDTRVNSGDIQPNDIIALLKINDFWIALVGVAAGVFHVFGVEFLQDEGSQAAAVNMIMAGIALFLRDNAARPSGMLVTTSVDGNPITVISKRKSQYQGAGASPR